MRRSAISVVANIVEGWARKTRKEKLNFYYTARGSLTELEYYIDLSLKLNYLMDKQHNDLAEIRQDIGKLLQGLINSLVTNR